MCRQRLPLVMGWRMVRHRMRVLARHHPGPSAHSSQFRLFLQVFQLRICGLSKTASFCMTLLAPLPFSQSFVAIENGRKVAGARGILRSVLC